MKAIEVEELLSNQKKESPRFKLEECLQVDTDEWCKVSNMFADTSKEKVIKLFETINYTYYLIILDWGEKQMWRNKT